MPDIATIHSHRTELIGYCYRFFGNYADAEDAVQETLTRAWQHADEFEHRSGVRRWLYAIATNVCLDMKKAPQRRYLPMDLSPAGQVPDGTTALETRPEVTWVGPISDDVLSDDPAEQAALRDSVRLAFITALQMLPPRQRVVLILRDVIAWSARECAELLDTTVAAVNAALNRARATLRDLDQGQAQPYDEKLLMNYIAAFEAYDVDRLVALLADDAKFSMPPYVLWLQGREAIETWWRGPGEICRGSRTIIVRANGQPAVAVYHPVSATQWNPFAIHVLDTAEGQIQAITHFMGAAVFRGFQLPPQLTASTIFLKIFESER